MEWARKDKELQEEARYAHVRIMTRKQLKEGEFLPFARQVEMDGFLVDPVGALRKGSELC